MKIEKRHLIFYSVLLNITLPFAAFSLWAYLGFMGCSEIANGRIGVLNQNIELTVFGEDKQLFTLPKGITIQDASPTGAGWFEIYRFKIIVSSEQPNLIDYSSHEAAKKYNKFAPLYSVKKEKTSP